MTEKKKGAGKPAPNKNEAIEQLIYDLKAQLQQAQNQASARGITSVMETLHAAQYTLKLLEYKINEQ